MLSLTWQQLPLLLLLSSCSKYSARNVSRALVEEVIDDG